MTDLIDYETKGDLVYIVTKSDISRASKSQLLGKTSSSVKRLRFGDITSASFNSDQNEAGKPFCAISCQYTNIRIFDVELTKLRKISSQNGGIITSVTLLKARDIFCYSHDSK